jgi:hypothetical protein
VENVPFPARYYRELILYIHYNKSFSGNETLSGRVFNVNLYGSAGMKSKGEVEEEICHYDYHWDIHQIHPVDLNESAFIHFISDPIKPKLAFHLSHHRNFISPENPSLAKQTIHQITTAALPVLALHTAVALHSPVVPDGCPSVLAVPLLVPVRFHINRPNALHYAFPGNGYVVVVAGLLSVVAGHKKAGEERRLLRGRTVVGIGPVDLVAEDIDRVGLEEADMNLGFDLVEVGKNQVVGLGWGIDLAVRVGHVESILSVRVGLVVGMLGGMGCEMSRRYLGAGFHRMGAALEEENRRSCLVAGAEALLRKEAELHADAVGWEMRRKMAVEGAVGLETHKKPEHHRMRIEGWVLANKNAGRLGVVAESAEIEGVRCMMCVMLHRVDMKWVVLSQNNLLDYLHAENSHIHCFHHVAAIKNFSIIQTPKKLQRTWPC